MMARGRGARGFLQAALGLPVFIVVLGGDDDHNGEDGAEHDGGDAHCQTDEGEVTSLARRNLRRHHVAPSHSSTHLHEYKHCSY